MSCICVNSIISNFQPSSNSSDLIELWPTNPTRTPPIYDPVEVSFLSLRLGSDWTLAGDVYVLVVTHNAQPNLNPIPTSHCHHHPNYYSTIGRKKHNDRILDPGDAHKQIWSGASALSKVCSPFKRFCLLSYAQSYYGANPHLSNFETYQIMRGHSIWEFRFLIGESHYRVALLLRVRSVRETLRGSSETRNVVHYN